jgi:hypothetical protein
VEAPVPAQTFEGRLRDLNQGGSRLTPPAAEVDGRPVSLPFEPGPRPATPRLLFEALRQPDYELLVREEVPGDRHLLDLDRREGALPFLGQELDLCPARRREGSTQEKRQQDMPA